MRHLPLLLILSCMCLLCSAQTGSGNCFNSGFETGDIEGYETYYGGINGQGEVTINTPGIVDNQHRVVSRMSETDGNDPNAFNYCIENKILKVVPPGAGQYTLRLGDINGGAKAARVVLEFDVTPQFSFFLLKYAVILEDPAHQFFEQPRFELNIKDTQGNLLDCGEYVVRAAETIEGFETCGGNLRVRPWTTAGFELQSFLGQRIRIEILTTDCSQGGHGGYAYIDATCKPLELRLDGYCPGTTKASYFVTEGFEKYEWNTGDTTNIIDIDNPIAGTEYQVTVTSATGCTLVLKDTLPTITVVPPLEFDPFPSYKICTGESMWFTPSGLNVETVECLTLGFEADSFLLNPLETIDYVFTTRDEYGCAVDTGIVHIDVVDLNFDIYPDYPCDDDDLGGFEIDPISGILPFELYLDGQLMDDPYAVTGLEPGFYTLTLFDSLGCERTKDLNLYQSVFPSVDAVNITPATCDRINGIISLPNNNNYEYALDDGPFASTNSFMNLAPGGYAIHITNDDDCMITIDVVIDNFPSPFFTDVQIDSTTCGFNNGEVQLMGEGGFGTLTFSVDNQNYYVDGNFIGLSDGPHTINIQDESGCIVSENIMVPSVPYPIIDDVLMTPTSCGLVNGALEIVGTEPLAGTQYRLGVGAFQNDHIYTDLLAGDYRVYLLDPIGCLDSQNVRVDAVSPPRLVGIQFSPQTCGFTYASFSLDIDMGTPPFQYSFDNQPMRSLDDEVNNIFPGRYSLVISDDYGCTIDTSIFIPPFDQIFIPNILTKNNDNINESLIIGVPDNSLAIVETYQIFSRWGEKIYDPGSFELNGGNGVSQFWNGELDNDAVTPGVYVYNIVLRFPDGRRYCRKGNVTVLR